MSILLVSSAIIYNFYTSAVVSFLVDNKHETNIKSREDLAASDLQIGFVDSVVVREFLDVRMF